MLDQVHYSATDLVGYNSELALLRVWTLLQHIVDESKELLHDSVLSHVIIARLDLQVPHNHRTVFIQQNSPLRKLSC